VLKVNWGMQRGFGYSPNALIFANSAALFTSPCEHPLNNAVGSMGESFFLVKPHNKNNEILAFGGLADKFAQKVMDCTLFESHGCPLSQLINLSGFFDRQYHRRAQKRSRRAQEYAVVHSHGCLQSALKACLSIKASLVIC
jgi:hypothetical protein